MSSHARSLPDHAVAKTLFDDEISEEFLSSLKNRAKPVYSRNHAGGYFLINVSDLANPKYKLFFCELNDNFVFLRENEASEHVAVMDVLNAFIRVTNSTLIRGERYYGLKFIKRQNFEEMFTQDENLVLEWHEHLKRYCRQIKFRNYFREVSLLGSGSFARGLDASGRGFGADGPNGRGSYRKLVRPPTPRACSTVGSSVDNTRSKSRRPETNLVSPGA